MELKVHVSEESLDKLAALIVGKLSGLTTATVAPAQPQMPAAVAPPQQQTFAPPSMQQMVNPYAPVEQQPTYQPPPPLGGPPRLEGNKMVFPPGNGQLNQMNGATDVMSGQPTAVSQAPAAAPVIPQMSNVPVNVGPVAVSAPVNPQLTAPIDAMGVKRLCLQLCNNNPDGQAKLQHILQQSGINAMVNVNDQNAGVLFAWLQQAGVQS
jgi:hypothetical protein